MTPRRAGRTPFSNDDDTLLMKYLATYNPSKSGRSGNAVFKWLVENPGGKWNWSEHHPWQAWRNRYVKNSEEFDYRITKYQLKKGIVSDAENVKAKMKGKEETAEAHGMAKRKRAKDGGRGKKVRILEEKNGKKDKIVVEMLGQEESGDDVDKIVAESHEEERSEDHVDVAAEPKPGPEDEMVEVAERSDSRPAETNDEDRDGPVGSWEYDGEIFDHEDEDGAEDGNNEDEEVDQLVDEDELDQAVIVPSDARDILSPETETDITRQSHEPSHMTEDLDEHIYPDVSTLPSPTLSQPHPPTSSLGGTSDAATISSTSTVSDSEKEPTSAHAQEPMAPTSAIAQGSPPTDARKEQKNPSPDRLVTTNRPTVPSHAAQRQLPRTKRKPNIEEEFFDDLQSSLIRQAQSTSRHQDELPKAKPPGVRGRPRMMMEGAFSNRFRDARGRLATKRAAIASDDNSDDDSDEGERWPPRRRRRAKAKEEIIDVDDLPSNQPRKQPDIKESSSPIPQIPPPLHHPFSQPTQHPFSQLTQHPSTEELLAQYSEEYSNSSASSSAGKVPAILPIDFSQHEHEMEGASHHPFSQQSQSPYGAVNSLLSPFKTPADMAGGADPENLAPWTRMEAFPLPARFANVPGLLNVRGTSRQPPDDRKTSRERRQPVVPPRPSVPKVSSDDRPPFPRAPTVVSPNDPFASSGNQKRRRKPTTDVKHRRQSFGGYDMHELVPNIDLAAKGSSSRGRRQTRTSMPARLQFPHSNASSPGSSLSLSSISAADQNIVGRIGIDSIIKRMSENHQFREEYIRGLWMKIGDLEKTDMLLGIMRAGAEEKGMAAMDGFPFTDVRPRSTHFSDPPRQRGSSGKRYQFEISTSSAGSVDSDYDPPESSRAGQFSRLVRQGRREEALKREHRRASQGGISPRKVRVVNLLDGKSVSPPPSPTTDVKMSKALRQDDDEGDDEDDKEMDYDDVEPEEPLWEESDDAVLRSGDDQALRDLEQRMGKGSVKQRFAKLFGF